MNKLLKFSVLCAILLQSTMLANTSDFILKLYIESSKNVADSPNDPDPVTELYLLAYERKTVFAVYRDTEGNFFSSAKDVIWHCTNTQVVDLPTGSSDSINIYGKHYTYHAKISAYSPSLDTHYTTQIFCEFGASNKNNVNIDKNKILIKTYNKGCVIRVRQSLKNTLIGTIYSIKGQTIKTFLVTKNNTFIPFRHLGNSIYFVELKNKAQTVRKKVTFY